MKKTPNINPESQDVAELQAMVKALLASETQLKQERQCNGTVNLDGI
ncbi:hypothetical protein MEG05_16440 [Vibrio aestuarianus]|nr:hypothetical protein [Vibrio aestuarianus]MDE1315639.1 hypothetical protein [Vibrio aestuarianus]